jgi:hypothetical protein
VGASFAGMVSAAAAGFGVACWAKRLLRHHGLQVFDSLPRLPRVPDVRGGVLLRDGLDRSDLIELADAIAAAIAREGDAIPEATRRTASG